MARDPGNKVAFKARERETRAGLRHAKKKGPRYTRECMCVHKRMLLNKNNLIALQHGLCRMGSDCCLPISRIQQHSYSEGDPR